MLLLRRRRWQWRQAHKRGRLARRWHLRELARVVV